MTDHQRYSEAAEDFVNFIYEGFKIKLNYASNSLSLLDILAEHVNNLKAPHLEGVKRKMTAYLGETIIREFGGFWETEGSVKMGTTHLNVGSWVDKRLRYGMQDSITMKVAALLPLKQELQWSPYWEEDRAKASQFGQALLATAANNLWVDNWISQWLSCRKNYEMNDWEEPDFDEVNNELEQKLGEMSCRPVIKF